MSRMRNGWMVVAAIACAGAFALPAQAQSAEEILKKVDKSAFVKSSRAEMVQMVVTPSGDAAGHRAGLAESESSRGRKNTH